MLKGFRRVKRVERGIEGGPNDILLSLLLVVGHKPMLLRGGIEWIQLWLYQSFRLPSLAKTKLFHFAKA